MASDSVAIDRILLPFPPVFPVGYLNLLLSMTQAAQAISLVIATGPFLPLHVQTRLLSKFSGLLLRSLSFPLAAESERGARVDAFN